MIGSKKITGFIVVFTTTLPLVVFMFFMCHQKYIRWQMEEKLEEEQLTSVTISANDFKWYEDGKEIIINDHLFDVKSITKMPGDSLLVTGLYDYQEQKLQNDLDNWMKNERNSSNQNSQPIVKWLSSLYDDKINSQVEYSVDYKALERQIYSTLTFERIALKVLTPPPRILFF